MNDIKRAFRKLARRFHPDINPGDRHAEERFKRISEAYEILSDPSKRQFYDVNGFYTRRRSGAASGTTGMGIQFSGIRFFDDRPIVDFSEIFGRLSRSRAERREPERGQDLEYQISISFEDSIRGLQDADQRSCAMRLVRCV